MQTHGHLDKRGQMCLDLCTVALRQDVKKAQRIEAERTVQNVLLPYMHIPCRVCLSMGRYGPVGRRRRNFSAFTTCYDNRFLLLFFHNTTNKSTFSFPLHDKRLP